MWVRLVEIWRWGLGRILVQRGRTVYEMGMVEEMRFGFEGEKMMLDFGQFRE